MGIQHYNHPSNVDSKSGINNTRSKPESNYSLIHQPNAALVFQKNKTDNGAYLCLEVRGKAHYKGNSDLFDKMVDAQNWNNVQSYEVRLPNFNIL